MSTQRKPGKIHKMIHPIFASKGGSWLLARLLHHLDGLSLRLSKGRFTASSAVSGLPVVFLITKGARSGQPRQTPLVAMVDPNQPQILTVIASNWGGSRNPGWYYNLKAEPRAELIEEGQRRAVIAQELSGEGYQAAWRQAEAIYLGYSQYRRRAGDRHIPVFRLLPESASVTPPANP